MSNKPSLPKGTRDFGPEKMVKRNYILDTIKATFQKFGFQPLETPSMENLDVLTGKYGDEGDQLIFKILNSGDYLSKVTQDEINEGSKPLTSKICEKALRYDLTVPFARFVVMNRNEITFPFKRYQVQPVWRADRPQKGRYREFYQCDADVVGTDSLLCEAEIILMIKEVFTNFNITDYTIKINNRKILSGIAEVVGATGKETDLFVAIDKLDKIGIDKVAEELREKGFEEANIQKVKEVLTTSGSIEDTFSFIENLLAKSEAGKKGIEELKEIFSIVQKTGNNLTNIGFDLTLARGLSYYTGAIFEVKVNNVSIGSVSGGGRYDNLTGVFGLPDVPGVGFSFGVDRLYDVLEELQLFPNDTLKSTEVLICCFDQEGIDYSYPLLSKLRNSGIKTELYPEAAKIKKQLNYANSKFIPFVIMIGSNEITTGELTLKNMLTGEQSNLTIDKIIESVSIH